MRIKCFMKSRRVAGSVLVAAAGLAFAVAPIEAEAAEPCQDPTAAAQGVYETYYDDVADPFFPLADTKVCDRLTKSLVSTCTKAVSNARKCSLQALKSVFKSQLIGCSTTGPSQDSCEDFYTNENANEQIVISSATNEGNNICEQGMNGFWAYCMNAPP